jgi:hypothetical protein
MTAEQISDPELLQKENADLRFEVTYLKEQLAWFKRQIFGKKSERTVSSLNQEQLELTGLEAMQTAAEEQTQAVPAHKRRKPNRNGQDAIKLDPDLPVKTVVVDVSEEEKICKETGLPLVKIGEEISHKNGRCRMHGGIFFKREKHGRMTLRAKNERKMERAFLNEMKGLSREIGRKTQ